MEPYYDDGQITLYCGDCREVLPRLGPADAVITDPPYNVGVVYGEGVSDRRPDYEAWCRVWFAECRRLAPVVALTPGHVNLGVWARIEPPAWALAWLRPAAMARSPVGFSHWEPVLVWGRRTGTVTTTDVFTAPIVPDPTLAGHPCPKPLLWGRHLVARLTLPGGSVLDPFAGSGTVLRAAKDLGRRAVGVEINPDYCDLVVRRLAQQALPLEESAEQTAFAVTSVNSH